MDDSNSPDKGNAPSCAKLSCGWDNLPEDRESNALIDPEEPVKSHTKCTPEDVLRVKMDREERFFPKAVKEGIFDYDKSVCLTYEHQYEKDEDYPLPKLEFVEDQGFHPDLLRLAGLEDDDRITSFISMGKGNSHKHPGFSKPIDIGSIKDMTKFWNSCEEVDPQTFGEPKRHWRDLFRKQKSKLELIENSVSNYCDDPDLLAMAGVIGAEEAKACPRFRADSRILANLMECGELPESMELIFMDGKLCINGVPTIIREDDVRDLYNGYQAFNGADDAVDYAVKVLKDKLMVLFKREEEHPLFEGVQNA